MWEFLESLFKKANKPTTVEAIEGAIDPFARTFKTHFGALFHSLTPVFRKRVWAHTPEGHIPTEIQIMSSGDGWMARPLYREIKTPTLTSEPPFDRLFASQAQAEEITGNNEFWRAARENAPQGKVLDTIMFRREGNWWQAVPRIKKRRPSIEYFMIMLKRKLTVSRQNFRNISQNFLLPNRDIVIA